MDKLCRLKSINYFFSIIIIFVDHLAFNGNDAEQSRLAVFRGTAISVSLSHSE